MLKKWLVFNVGCFECGRVSGVIGCFGTEDEAKVVESACYKLLPWNCDFAGHFAIYDIEAQPDPTFAPAIAAATP